MIERIQLTPEIGVKLRGILRVERERIGDCWKIFQPEFKKRNQEPPPLPTVRFNFELETMAGRCRVNFDDGNSEIELNPHIYIAIKVRQRHEATIHEVAHCLANHLFGESCKHDRRWRWAMSVFNVSPTVCHDFNEEAGAARRVVCQFCGKEWRVSEKWVIDAHDRSPEGRITVVCDSKQCGSMIRPVDIFRR